MFALVKRVGEKDENLASSFYSILLSTHSLMLFFILKYMVPIGFFSKKPYSILLKLILVCFFVIWYFLCKYYFIIKENYKTIISVNEKKFTDNNWIAIIGIIYSIVTFLVFYVTAIYLANGTFF